MTLGWNILGILAWLILVLYLIFIVQNIRKRHLIMIVKDRKRFEWKTTLLDILEVLLLLCGAIYMFSITLFYNPNLKNKQVLSSKIEYQPLILTAGNKRSYYVTAKSDNKKTPIQTYTFYSNGNRVTVTSNYATISDGKNPMSVQAGAIPYSSKQLVQADARYQNAYVATYTATYKKNWQNGLRMHAGKTAAKYYLIRVPDRTFVRELK